MSGARARGFTLVELAVVLAIVTLLMSTMLFTLSAQTEARNFAENARRLEQIRELTLGYAVSNRRLPCPATSTSVGQESLTAGTCTSFYDGYVPAKTIGF